jgi:hypothetical protein
MGAHTITFVDVELFRGVRLHLICIDATQPDGDAELERLLGGDAMKIRLTGALLSALFLCASADLAAAEQGRGAAGVVSPVWNNTTKTLLARKEQRGFKLRTSRPARVTAWI